MLNNSNLPNLKLGKIDPNISRDNDLSDVSSEDLLEFVVPRTNPMIFRSVLKSIIIEKVAPLVGKKGKIVKSPNFHIPYYTSHGAFKGVITFEKIIESREILKFLKGLK